MSAHIWTPVPGCVCKKCVAAQAQAEELRRQNEANDRLAAERDSANQMLSQMSEQMWELRSMLREAMQVAPRNKIEPGILDLIDRLLESNDGR